MMRRNLFDEQKRRVGTSLMVEFTVRRSDAEAFAETVLTVAAEVSEGSSRFYPSTLQKLLFNYIGPAHEPKLYARAYLTWYQLACDHSSLAHFASKHL